MTVYRAVAGDNLTPLPATLDGVSNLTGATVVAHLQPVGTGSSHTLDVTVLSATDRTVTLDLVASANVAPGPYRLEWQATYPDTTVLSWPTTGTDWLIVRPQLA